MTVALSEIIAPAPETEKFHCYCSKLFTRFKTNVYVRSILDLKHKFLQVHNFHMESVRAVIASLHQRDFLWVTFTYKENLVKANVHQKVKILQNWLINIQISALKHLVLDTTLTHIFPSRKNFSSLSPRSRICHPWVQSIQGCCNSTS